MPPKELWHILSNIRVDAMIADCQVCGVDVPIARRVPRPSHGERGLMCRVTRNRGRVQRYEIARKYKKSHCERCGLVPEDPCVLEVDHILDRAKGGTDDGENLQTLCANCHKIKTWRPDLFSKGT